jgi:hypothetical protein
LDDGRAGQVVLRKVVQQADRLVAEFSPDGNSKPR